MNEGKLKCLFKMNLMEHLTRGHHGAVTLSLYFSSVFINGRNENRMEIVTNYEMFAWKLFAFFFSLLSLTISATR